jgi:hypothetical protein
LLHQRRQIVILLYLLVLGLVPLQAAAQNRYARTLMVGLMAGLGGSTGGEPDAGFDNLTWQAVFTMDIEKDVRWGAHLGQLGLDPDDGIHAETDLTYLTFYGEYLRSGPFYESGLYLGLGFYDLDGRRVDESSLGFNAGVTAGFELSERLLLLLDLSMHYADLNHTQVFGMVHVGLGYRF